MPQVTAVPAVIDLCVTAMQQWGKLSFEQVSVPLLRILDNGSTSWYDELAVTVRKLIQSEKDCNSTEGRHRTVWDGKDGRANPLPTGCYIVKFSQNGATVCQRLMLTR